jgi:gamma-D-glutamyl-L-lysine dipeptidyl-peptidase
MWYPFKKLTGNSLILLIALGFASSCKPEQNDLELSQFLVDSIQSQTIPDTRTEVFSIKASYSAGSILLKGKTTSTEALSKLRAVLKNQHVEFTDSIILLPDPALKGKTWGLVTLSVANLRYTPAHSAEMATQALMGSPLKVLQEENGWFLVQTPDQYIAWTEAAGIALLTSMEMDRWKSSERIIFLEGTGQVLQEPLPGARPVTDIVTGGILSPGTGKTTGSSYTPVKLPDGREGFIPASACKNFND